jgi:uroporphyrinogen decarboxylase
MTSHFEKTLNGTVTSPPPLWLMRQAGRYLKEYKAVRSSEPDFISFCLNPKKAVEVTLQPIEKFDFDAAIIFSDILMVPWALNRNVRFEPGKGPLMTPLEATSQILNSDMDSLQTKLAPVGAAISGCRAALSPDKSLIGFAGAPWTVITYMLEGQSSRDFARSRTWLWDNGGEFEALLELVTEATINFLELQARAGANALMIFDSWAGAVPSEFRTQVVINPIRKIIEELRRRGCHQPVIGFPKGIGEGLIAYCDEAGIQGVGLDHGCDVTWAAANLPKHIVVQGNLDPLSLISGGAKMEVAIANIREAFHDRAHIFNLGHGITPETPVQNVHHLINLIRDSGDRDNSGAGTDV